MSGSLFRNDRKNNDKSPDYQGTVMINGVEMWINGWLKEGNNGKFFSLAFKPKEQQSTGKSKTMTAHNGEVYDRKDVERHVKESRQSFHEDLDDDLPF